MTILSRKTQGNTLQFTVDELPTVGGGIPAPLGSTAQVIKNGTGSSWTKIGPLDIDWVNDNDEDFKTSTFIFEDWQAGAVGGETGFIAAQATGTSNVTSLAPSGNLCGIATLSSGVAAGNYASLASHATNQGNLILSGKVITWEALVQVNQIANLKAFNTGLGRLVSALEQNYGVYFRIKGSESNAFWICKTANNNVRTTVITTTPVQLSTFTSLKFVSDGTSVKFFINGALVATITTNLPTLALHRFINVQCDATAEANALVASIDYMALTIHFPNPRL